MAETEKQIVQAMADAISDLPEEKKQYFVGFAEGVAAMADRIKSSSSANEGS